jgi:hypothetical protein
MSRGFEISNATYAKCSCGRTRVTTAEHPTYDESCLIHESFLAVYQMLWSAGAFGAAPAPCSMQSIRSAQAASHAASADEPAERSSTSVGALEGRPGALSGHFIRHRLSGRIRQTCRCRRIHGPCLFLEPVHAFETQSAIIRLYSLKNQLLMFIVVSTT